jgi:hypothetical protein
LQQHQIKILCQVFFLVEPVVDEHESILVNYWKDGMDVNEVRARAIARRTRDLPHQPHQNRDFSAHTSMRYSKQLKY